MIYVPEGEGKIERSVPWRDAAWLWHRSPENRSEHEHPRLGEFVQPPSEVDAVRVSDGAREPVLEIGARWFRASSTPVLSVPSVVIPHERNFVLNPAHREFAKIAIGRSEPFRFDPRMWKG
jgi:hypothetical protein